MPFYKSADVAVSGRSPAQQQPARPGSQDALLAEVRALDAKLDVLIAEVRALSSRGRRPVAPLSREDRAVLAKLLPAIAGALGSEQFTSRDLPDEPGVRGMLGTLSIKQVGRLLSRAEGIPIEGYLVERCGVEINVARWRVLVSVSKRLESGTALEHSGSIDVGEPNA